MRHNHKEVPIPNWMKNLPLDKRGYPITFTTTIADGKPYFEVVDEYKRQLCLKEDLCSVCGRKLVKNRALVGGPLSAFHDGGAYIDVPMHIECAQYALQVCPYLAVPGYKKVSDLEKLRDRTGVPVASNTMMPDRPELFVLIVHQKARHIMHENYPMLVKYVKPVVPYKWAEYWRDGKRIDDDAGLAEAKEITASQLEKDILEAMQENR